MKRRMHAALLSVLALILGTGALVLSTAGTASADLAGTVTLTPATGTVAAVPAFPEISVSAPCPEPYQAKLGVYLTINGTDDLLANNLTDGAPFSGSTITTHLPATAGAFNRSINTTFSTAHQTVADGTYPLHIQCLAADGTKADGMFATAIQITGSTWAAATTSVPTGTSLAVTASPAGHTVVNHEVVITATVTPSTAVGTVTFANSATPFAKDVPLVNGVATATLSGASTPGPAAITATFKPTDPLAFGTSQGALSYGIVDEPGITVLDSSDNTLDENANLTKGQTVKVSAEGFLPTGTDGHGEPVGFAVDGKKVHDDLVSNNAGKLTNIQVTLPDDLADGTHSLDLTGATSAIKLSFPFRTGATSTPTPDPSDTGTDGGTTDGSSDGGTTDGSTDAGTTSGSTTDGAASDAGTSTGSSDAGTATGTTGGSSGGSDGPLAATGATGIVPLGVLALLMITGGGYAAYRVRRDGRLLSFGPSPRD
ncbi:hypothetical protein [Streptomyces sp. NPDC021020]|uniref:hypothetical protein n=1 Tax=Streptomyces sp. NPDC021020 TaxID=3365109 RepID=UPI0037AA2F0F